MKKRILLSTIDQGLISLYNFSLNLLLIKIFSNEEYGMFAFIFALGLFCVGIQNALINTPYSIHLHNKIHLQKHLPTVNFLLSLCLPLLGTSLIVWANETIAITNNCIMIYLFVFLYKEYFRNQWIVENQIKRAIYSDVIFLLLLICFAAGYWQINTDSIERLSLETVLYVISVCSFLSIIIPLSLEFSQLIKSWRRIKVHLNDYFSLWGQSKWSLLGVISSELQSRGYIYIVSFFFGLQTLAILQAGRVFFGPLNLIISGWSRVVRPELASIHQQSNTVKFMGIIKKSQWLFFISNLVLAIILYSSWNLLEMYLYQNKYPQIAWVVFLWAIVYLFFNFRTIYATGIQSINRFDYLSKAGILTAILSLGILFIIILLNLPDYIIFSVILSELIFYLILKNFLMKSLTNQSN